MAVRIYQVVKGNKVEIQITGDHNMGRQDFEDILNKLMKTWPENKEMMLQVMKEKAE